MSIYDQLSWACRSSSYASTFTNPYVCSWVRAVLLIVGDHLTQLSGEFAIVTEIKNVQSSFYKDLISFEVSEFRTFFVSNALIIAYNPNVRNYIELLIQSTLRHLKQEEVVCTRSNCKAYYNPAHRSKGYC